LVTSDKRAGRRHLVRSRILANLPLGVSY